MLNIDSLEKGIVIDHIKAGRGMFVYNYLKLGDLDSCVALIKNVKSSKQGRKDLIKIDDTIDIDLKILGFIDPNITINIVDNGKIVDKIKLELPEKIIDVVKCKNPRCITSIENGAVHEFKLTDKDKAIYRCIYCDTVYSN